eukprot:6187422-Pleurochrysis_carterae.AAC.4
MMMMMRRRRASSRPRRASSRPRSSWQTRPTSKRRLAAGRAHSRERARARTDARERVFRFVVFSCFPEAFSTAFVSVAFGPLPRRRFCRRSRSRILASTLPKRALAPALTLARSLTRTLAICLCESRRCTRPRSKRRRRCRPPSPPHPTPSGQRSR